VPRLHARPTRDITLLAAVTAVAVTVALAGQTSSSAHTVPTSAVTSMRAGHARAAGCTQAGVLHQWSLRRLAEQTVVVPVDEDHVGAASREVAAGAGGLILFGSQAPPDLGSRLAHLQSLAPGGVPPIVMTDEEGGTVQRMPNLVGSMPSARYMGAHWSPRRIHRAAERMAMRMHAARVTMDLAPVLDLDGRAGPSASDAIGTRSFSPRRTVATPDGLAFATGLQAGGVVPVVKHFPGMGGADGNSDLGPSSTPPWSEVRTNDLRPFQTAVRSGLPAVMVSNVRVPGLTTLPSSLSYAVVYRLLRQQLGFDGLVVPDSLSAGAVTAAGFGLDRAAVRGLAVGDDMVLFTVARGRLWSATQGVVGAVVSAVRSGSLGRSRLEQAAAHVLGAKHVDLCAAG
jgi:beta-N-acetylhexosaminidase